MVGNQTPRISFYFTSKDTVSNLKAKRAHALLDQMQG